MKKKLHKLNEYNDHEIQELFVGSFYCVDDDDDVITEYTLGKIENKISVFVYSNEGDRVPHMHFESKDGKLDGCIKIENAEYFKHGTHKSTLTKKQAKNFHNFMKAKHSTEPSTNLSNWEYAVKYWDRASHHNTKHIAEILEIPDYSNLNHPVYYRYTIDGIGIYEYVRRNTDHKTWDSFMESEHVNWLEIPDYKKYKNMTSWFKKEGNDMFEKYTLPYLEKMIHGIKEVKPETKEIHDDRIQYSDPYQILI